MSDLRLNHFEPVLTGYLRSCHNRQPVAVAVRRNLAEKPDQTGLPDTSPYDCTGCSWGRRLLRRARRTGDHEIILVARLHPSHMRNEVSWSNVGGSVEQGGPSPWNTQIWNTSRIRWASEVGQVNCSLDGRDENIPFNRHFLLDG